MNERHIGQAERISGIVVNFCLAFACVAAGAATLIIATTWN